VSKGSDVFLIFACRFFILLLYLCDSCLRLTNACSYVGKDVVEPLLCAMEGEEDAAELAKQELVRDSILKFSRQNTKLRAAEADFERLLKSSEDLKELFKSLSEGGAGTTLMKIEV
jgi:hypothetical protein